MVPLKLPKTKKNEARQRIADIANEKTAFVFFSDHCEMRMIQRDITLRQVMQVLRNGNLNGDISWDTEHESGWKMRLKRISAGAEVVVVAKLVEREDDCVIAITTFEKF